MKAVVSYFIQLSNYFSWVVKCGPCSPTCFEGETPPIYLLIGGIFEIVHSSSSDFPKEIC